MIRDILRGQEGMFLASRLKATAGAEQRAREHERELAELDGSKEFPYDTSNSLNALVDVDNAFSWLQTLFNFGRANLRILQDAHRESGRMIRGNIEAETTKVSFEDESRGIHPYYSQKHIESFELFEETFGRAIDFCRVYARLLTDAPAKQYV